MSDFEEYVAGRGPALVAFALLVSGDEDTALRLAQDALGAAVGRWDHLVHDEDPDAHLRRDVVAAARRRERLRVGRRRSDRSATPGAWEALPVATRAAVVLRCREERPWPEVAWTTGLSERTAQHQVERGLATLGGTPAEARDLLASRTEAVGVRPVLLAEGAARAGRLRRVRRVRAVVAAAVGVAVAAPAAVQAWPSGSGLPDLGPGPDDGTTLQAVLPDGWRTETWRGVEVGVPDDWDRGALDAWCRTGDDPTPRVARPVVGDEGGCDPALAPGLQFRPDGVPAPRAPDGLAVGERVLDGVVVWVATPDEALTEQVLATARTVERTDSAGCAVQRPVPRAGKNFAVPEPAPTALSVCRYEVGISGSNLVQSERLSVIDSLEAREAVDAAPTVVAPLGCLDGPGEQVVVLTSEDGDLAWIHLGRCQGMDDDATHLLTEEVLYWALSPGWEGPRDDLPLPDDLRVDPPA